MIVSIMLNYVATLFMGYVYTTLLRDGSVPQTVAVADSMKIAGISKGFPAHWGVLAAFLLAAVLYYFIFYTSKGFKLRAVGMNATAAFFNGFPVNKYIPVFFYHFRRYCRTWRKHRTSWKTVPAYEAVLAPALVSMAWQLH